MAETFVITPAIMLILILITMMLSGNDSDL